MRVWQCLSGWVVVVISLVGCWADAFAQSGRVVVYTALDEMYSRPILDAFEREKGISVEAVYDTEAAKTTGLVNRLIAEARRPRADVFWNNEVVQTIVLKNKGILEPFASKAAQGIPKAFKDPEAYWAGFAARARVIIYNTDLVAPPPHLHSRPALARVVRKVCHSQTSIWNDGDARGRVVCGVGPRQGQDLLPGIEREQRGGVGR